MKVRNLRWRFYRASNGPQRRCKEYEPGCLVCESYRFLAEHGRFPTSDERIAISDAILGNAALSELGAEHFGAEGK